MDLADETATLQVESFHLSPGILASHLGTHTATYENLDVDVAFTQITNCDLDIGVDLADETATLQVESFHLSPGILASHLGTHTATYENLDVDVAFTQITNCDLDIGVDLADDTATLQVESFHLSPGILASHLGTHTATYENLDVDVAFTQITNCDLDIGVDLADDTATLQVESLHLSPGRNNSGDSGYVVIRAIRPPNTVYRPAPPTSSDFTPSPAANGRTNDASIFVKYDIKRKNFCWFLRFLC